MRKIPHIPRARTFIHRPVDLGYSDLEAETLDDGKREYKTPSGHRYPSVTTVLGIRKRHIIAEWRARVGAQEANRVSRIAAGRGSSFHLMCERYIKNIDPVLVGNEMPNALAMFRGALETINTRIGVIYAQEFPLYSDHLGLGGRVDLVAEFDGHLAIIDFKSSSRHKSRDDIHEYFIQEAAYAIMFEERSGIPVSRLITIMGVDGMDKPLIFQEKRDHWTTELHKTIADYAHENSNGHAG